VLYRRGGRLVLKSPQHSFRISVLARMFPRARFVQVVRDPYVIFSSTRHFWTTTYEQFALQAPPFHGVEEMVLDTFARMHDALAAAAAELPADRFLKVHYEDLVADPVEQVAALYDRLQLGEFEPARGAVAAYCEQNRDYQTNRYELTPEEIELVTARWRKYIEGDGYAVRMSPAASCA
jgi:omega-hydroxy-beta-dihydromenaquinone-9 sulfotransferase